MKKNWFVLENAEIFWMLFFNHFVEMYILQLVHKLRKKRVLALGECWIHVLRKNFLSFYLKVNKLQSEPFEIAVLLHFNSYYTNLCTNNDIDQILFSISLGHLHYPNSSRMLARCLKPNEMRISSHQGSWSYIRHFK
jgi:hypothetical protein